MTAPHEGSRIRNLVREWAARLGSGPASALIALLSWEFLVRILEIRQSTLPSPTRVILQIWRDAPRLADHAQVTAREALAGLLASVLAGYLLAVSMTVSTRMRRLAGPVLLMLRVVPFLALAPLFFLWLGMGFMTATALAFMACFLPTAFRLLAGLDSVPEETLEIVRSMRCPQIRELFKIRLPASFPYATRAAKACTPLAFAAATVAECVASGSGLGFLMMSAASRVDTTGLIAALAVLVLMIITVYMAISALEHVWLPWASSAPPGWQADPHG